MNNLAVISPEVAQQISADSAELHQHNHEAIVRENVAGLDAELATKLSDRAAQLEAQKSLRERATKAANEAAVPSADVESEGHKISGKVVHVDVNAGNRTAQATRKRGRVSKLLDRATEKVKSTYHLTGAHAYLAGNEATAAAKTKYDALDPKTQERLKSTGIGIVVAGTLGAVFAKISGMSGGGSNLAPMDLPDGAHHDAVGQAVHDVVNQKNNQSGQVFEVRHAGFNMPVDPGDTGGHGAGNPADPNAGAGGNTAPAAADLQLDDVQKSEGWDGYLKDAGMSSAQERGAALQDHNLINTLITQKDAKVQSGHGLWISHSGTLHDPSKAALNEFHHNWVAGHPAEVNGSGIKLTANHNELIVANGQGRATIELPDGYNAKVDKEGVLHITTPKNEELKIALPKDALQADGQLNADAQKKITDALKANGLAVGLKQFNPKLTRMGGAPLVEHVKPGQTHATRIEYNTGPNSHGLQIQHKNGTVKIDASHMSKDGWADTKGASMNALPTHVALTDADGQTYMMELDGNRQLFIAPDSEFGKMLADGRHITVRAGIWDEANNVFHSGATATPQAEPAHFGANFENIQGQDDALTGVDTRITVTASGTNTGGGGPAVLGSRGNGNDSTTGGGASSGPSTPINPTTSSTPATASQIPSAPPQTPLAQPPPKSGQGVSRLTDGKNAYPGDGGPDWWVLGPLIGVSALAATAVAAKARKSKKGNS